MSPESTEEESSEAARIARVYEAYSLSPEKRAAWSSENAGSMAIVRAFHQELRQTLARGGSVDLAHSRVLEIGCGSGGNLELLREMGAAASMIHGVDVIPSRIDEARRRFPEMQLQLCDAQQLPYPPDYFEWVLVSVVYSSILDNNVAENVATEIIRVLKPGGAVIWYDLRFPNPFNPNVRPYTRSQLAVLFPGFAARLRTTTLLPPLARGLRGPFLRLYGPLSKVPFLRSHYVGLLVKPS